MSPKIAYFVSERFYCQSELFPQQMYHLEGLPWALKRRNACTFRLGELIIAVFALDQPEDHFALFGDHVLVPGWIPDDLDFGFGHSGDAFEVNFGVVCDDRAHAATGRG